jgi:hypothetical protein
MYLQNCHFNCEGDTSVTCGGSGGADVYDALPPPPTSDPLASSFVGCFKDDNEK